MHASSNATLKTEHENRQCPPLATARVVGLGPGARETLVAAGGRVLSVFERCIYLRAESGHIACLGPRELGDGPLQVSCDGSGQHPWIPFGLRANDSWCIDGPMLIVADQQSFDLSGARPWDPAPAVPSIDAAALAASLSRLSRQTEGKRPDMGLGYLVPTLAGIVASEGGGLFPFFELQAPRRLDPVARTVEPLIAELFGATGIDESRLPEVAHRLLGLGPGLTPSGDDFVGGLLIALRLLGMSELAERIGCRILPDCARLTNVISAAHLRWAARGVGGSVLHGTLNALFQGDHDALDGSLSALSGVGHSSGWDSLAGAVLGCALWSIR